MYTKNQFRTVQRIFVETQKRFPTSEDMEKIYECDRDMYSDFEGTFAEYFGNPLEDFMDFCCLTVIIEDALAS